MLQNIGISIYFSQKQHPEVKQKDTDSEPIYSQKREMGAKSRSSFSQRVKAARLLYKREKSTAKTTTLANSSKNGPLWNVKIIHNL